MLTILDFIFYRVTARYKYSWSASDPQRFGVSIVSLFVILVLLDLYTVIDALILKVPFGRYANALTITVVVAATFTLAAIRYYRYQTFEGLESRWGVGRGRSWRWQVVSIWLLVVVMLGVFVFLP